MPHTITPDMVTAGDTITAAFCPDGELIAAPYPLKVDEVERHPFAAFYALVCGDGALTLDGRATVTVSN